MKYIKKCYLNILAIIQQLPTNILVGFHIQILTLHFQLNRAIFILKSRKFKFFFLCRFHALSYRAKHKDLTGFGMVVSSIKETKLLDDDD